MKPFEKLTKAQFVSFCLLSVCSGIMIGIGGTAFLLARSLYGEWGRLIGAIFFSLGILAIVTFGMKLFTGLISDMPEMGVKNWWKLPVCFLGNALGVILAAFLADQLPLADSIAQEARTMMQAKMNASNWGLSALCSSAFCGFLITLSIGSGNYAPRKKLSVTVGVAFPIIVFAFCGFDHSVANTFYCFFLGFSKKSVAYILVCALGNILGGVVLPLISLFRAWADKSAKQPENLSDTPSENQQNQPKENEI